MLYLLLRVASFYFNSMDWFNTGMIHNYIIFNKELKQNLFNTDFDTLFQFDRKYSTNKTSTNVFF